MGTNEVCTYTASRSFIGSSNKVAKICSLLPPPPWVSTLCPPGALEKNPSPNPGHCSRHPHWSAVWLRWWYLNSSLWCNMSPSHFHKVQTVAKKLYNACSWPRSGFLAPSSSLSFFHLHHQQPVCCEIILYPMLYCNHAIILIIPLREIIHVCISFPHLPFLTTPSHLSATEFTDFHNWHIFSISYSAFSWIWDPNIYRHRLGIEITQTDRRWTQRQRENEIIMNKHKENGNIYSAPKMWPYHVERTFQILETLQKWRVLSTFRIKLGSRTGWSFIYDGGFFCFDILKTQRTNENILVFWPYV